MRKEILHGIIASLLLASIYFAIVSFVQGISHAVEQFLSLWYLMLPLIIGFGVQVGLFSYIRTSLKALQANASMAASSAMSSGSMIACCAHHLTDVLPVLGLIGISVFLTQYQAFFILLGILSNFVGIILMMSIIQKHKLYENCAIFSKLEKINLEKTRNIAVIGSVLILVFVFFTAPNSDASNSLIPANSNGLNFAKVSDSKNSVDVVVTPKISSTQNSEFFVSFNTHSVALDFDPAKVSFIEVDGKKLLPIKWNGSAVGGHHREGTILFPSIEKNFNSIKFIISEDSGIGERIFEWKVNSN
ncbi:MAG: hypothetical protein Q7S21_01880 [archaeon]|nr:hypothetical protein [archaeon]